MWTVAYKVQLKYNISDRQISISCISKKTVDCLFLKDLMFFLIWDGYHKAIFNLHQNFETRY